MEDKLIGTIHYKSRASQYAAFIIGLALLYVGTTGSTVCYALGIIVIVIALLATFIIKDHECIQVYPEYLYIVEKKQRINNSEIKEWTINNGGEPGYNVIFTLNDGKKVQVDTFQYSKSYEVLSKTIKDKTAGNIHRGEKKLKFRNPLKKQKSE